MSTPPLLHTLRKTLLLLPAVVAVSACATATAGRTSGAPGAAGEQEVERGPRVQIWATEEPGSGSRVRPSFRLDDDAYVIVVNVGLDGYANVIFPESPEDDGFMRGGRTYRLPSVFTGFATNFRAADYRRFHNAVARYDDIYDRYAGYVFIIASWRPMHFGLTEAMGLWSDYRLAVHERQLDPYVVMRDFADKLVAGRTRDYTARYARYAAFRGGFADGGRGISTFCALYGAPFGYFPRRSAAGGLRIPLYGYGYSGVAATCGYGYDYAFVGNRPWRRTVVRPPSTPAPPPSNPDTATSPPPKDAPRPPGTRGREDGGEPKKRPGERPRRERAAEAEEETIVDVNRETRAQARRDRDAERTAWGPRGDRGYQRGSEWGRSERSSRSRDAQRDAGRSERVRRHEPADYDGGDRGASSRSAGQQRSSEPRRDPPPRAEPRQEPRQEPRSQPTPRSEPASRSEPRGERPAPKPTERR